jgi:hypothetical protein
VVTVSGPNGTRQTIDVNVIAGQPVRRMLNLENVNFEELEKEVAKP